ncbi:LMBR1-like membrane protein-domain-containing protein [Cokeromyces recurvatus]|uniref:LMBR1-like membrane protein-domain-containing protein n=1 Tax=Cokeromyces recurvatus TaxID=90255 RepID=UPI0022207860|nr:LMBR1-like membrane protein-domain-containing protein [Cokeromyces recurvatus]KAI7900291.1 LMBR1-like membrane protein-domain-containing protein [Cokeromyces recurvatus]
MIAVEGIAWIVYGIVVTLLFLFSIVFTRYFQNKHESEFFATLITILALGLVFSTLILLPVDIFLVSSTVDQTKGIKKEWATPETVEMMTLSIKTAYYICYGLITLFSFFLIPFAYFYYEEYDDEETRKERVLSALKYTSFFVIISILLFIFGLFLKPTTKIPKIDLDWFKKLLTDNNGEKAITFVIACLILLGMLVFIAYTAPGLSLLPLQLIKGQKRIDAKVEDIENRLVSIRERQRMLLSKYMNRTIPNKDRRELDELEDEERILIRRMRNIEEDKSSLLIKLYTSLRPFEIVFGILLLCLTLVLIISIFLTIVDKIAFSLCGSQCGYVINHPNLFNPINYVFMKLSAIFPLDYIFMVSLILYFFLTTMLGIIQIGIRFLWITLYRIKRGSTAPQALLFSTVLLTLSLLALNYTMTTTVAPGYAHFGSQVYCNQTTLTGYRDCSQHKELIVRCDVFGPTDICTPTISSSIIDRIIVNTPFFGVFFYYSQWIFLLVFIIGFIIALFKRSRSCSKIDLQELVDDDEEEEESLLDRRKQTRNYHTA